MIRGNWFLQTREAEESSFDNTDEVYGQNRAALTKSIINARVIPGGKFFRVGLDVRNHMVTVLVT
jgi:hypothetical protein